MDSSPNSITAEPLGGRYQLGEVIGRGGMASVYTAKDLILGRDVALKLFAPQSADTDELRRQEAEIQLLATLHHPSLVTLFDAGTDDRVPDEPRPFLTMELVDGEDLRTRIRRSPLPLDELAVVGAGIADALGYVHGLGIVHRDIKPANILLVPVRPGEPLRPKLTDFGIARIIDGTRLTATGTMVGTAAYLSPEQARGADLGPASDIYSLGLVLLECLKGEVEYPGSAVESAVARLHRAPVIPDAVPEEWARLIQAMTVLEPLDRPSATELEEAFRIALVSPGSLPGPVKAEPTLILPAPPARRPRRPRPGAAGRRAGTRPLNLLDPDALPPTAAPPPLAFAWNRMVPPGPAPHPRGRAARRAGSPCCRRNDRAHPARPCGARRRPLPHRYGAARRSSEGTAKGRGTMSHSQTAGQDRSGSRHRTPAGLLAGLLVAGALAGCGSPAPELGRDAARQLQSQVLAVSEAAAANDPAGSLKHLDELLTRLDAAAASGEVSFRRHQSIKASIDAVRAELAAQQAAEAARKAAEIASAEQAAAAPGGGSGGGRRPDCPGRRRPGSGRRR